MAALKISNAFFMICLCIHCLAQQTFPYVSFHGKTLANHSYVNLSLVGQDHSGVDSVQCRTDLSTCCGSAQGIHRGDWYLPDGNRLPFSDDADVFESRKAHRVDLFHRKTNMTGIYRCDIPTNAVHDDTDTSVKDTVYVGLYLHGGEHNINRRQDQLLNSPLQVMSQLKPLTFPCKKIMFLNSFSPVSQLVDLLPMSLGPETQPLSLMKLRLCWMTQ